MAIKADSEIGIEQKNAGNHIDAKGLGKSPVGQERHWGMLPAGAGESSW
jgi:hypothetical protein